MDKTHVFLDRVSKRFGKFEAVKNLTLSVEEGSFVTLLGPSGCGKTTTLRMLAGFYDPDEGGIYFHGKSQQGIPPEKRETSIVFQEYALFPHMSVFENVSYGLRIQHLNKKEVQMRGEEVLEQVGLKGLEKRFPYELSGGQQQRVALARSIIMKPRILLMDEPLSNLDAKLRVNVRGEIKQLQSQLKITTIYVTHDQEEALVLSDKIAVMNEGVLKQVGNALDLYSKPEDPWVANFIGTANLIEAQVQEISERGISILIGNSSLLLRRETIRKDNLKVEQGAKVLLTIRPEWVVVGKTADAMTGVDFFITGTVLTQAFTGAYVRYWIRIDGLEGNFIADDHQSRTNGIMSGEIRIGLKSTDIYILPQS
jgi:ABC-type Fe3+/spermidine/putrescine transport system ATPase subunit